MDIDTVLTLINDYCNEGNRELIIEDASNIPLEIISINISDNSFTLVVG
jgi:hypothetical protein